MIMQPPGRIGGPGDGFRGRLVECERILKPGGSLFICNLPKWNISIGAMLMELGLNFRHWIAIEMSASLPIQSIPA